MFSININATIQYLAEYYEEEDCDSDIVYVCFMHAVKRAMNNETITTSVVTEIVECVDCANALATFSYPKDKVRGIQKIR